MFNYRRKEDYLSRLFLETIAVRHGGNCSDQEDLDILLTPKRITIGGITRYFYRYATFPELANPPGTNHLIDIRYQIYDHLMGKLLVPKDPFIDERFALIVPRDTNLNTKDKEWLGRELGWCNKLRDRFTAALGIQGLIRNSTFFVRFGELYPGHETSIEPNFHASIAQELYDPSEVQHRIEFPYVPPVFTDMMMFRVTAPKDASIMHIRCCSYSMASKAKVVSKIAGRSVLLKTRSLCSDKDGWFYDFVMKITDEMRPIIDDAQYAWENTPRLAWRSE